MARTFPVRRVGSDADERDVDYVRTDFESIETDRTE
jgi:hypothetical protein